MVAVYWPLTALVGTFTTIWGFQVAELSPFTLVAFVTGCGVTPRVVTGTVVKVAAPLVTTNPLTP